MPSRTNENPGAEYPTWVGLIFVFNLIVGTGALTLPAVFARAGWLISLLIIISLGVISYMTATFIVETMACANAIKNWLDLQVLHQHVLNNEEYENKINTGNSESDTAQLLGRTAHDALHNNLASNAATAAENVSSSSNSNVDEELERLPLYAQQHPTTTMYYYNLDKKFELGQMVVLFFNDTGRMIFYLCIAIYLYGDMSIYSAAVAKSLRDVLCDACNSSSSFTLTKVNLRFFAENALVNSGNDLCWKDHTLTRFDVYRLHLIGFTVLLGPFAIFSVQKTKYIQILTATFRWLAFTFMIAIATKLMITKGPQKPAAVGPITGLPPLFGACVYSFMCHHSLPSLLTPIRNKNSLGKLLFYDYLLIATFYVLLAMTGIFAFSHLEDLYTLNFLPSNADEETTSIVLSLIIDYFLALFPVFTLCASYPIIAITLRTNLQTLFLDMTRFETYNFFVRRLLFPMLAVIPPFAITFFTESVTSLVGFTGSYAGVGIQYIIPIALVYLARNTCEELLGRGVTNEFRSPFKSTNYLLFVLICAITCMCLVTVNNFIAFS